MRLVIIQGYLMVFVYLFKILDFNMHMTCIIIIMPGENKLSKLL